MRLINNTDNEMLKTIQISIMTSGRVKMLEYFKNKAEKSKIEADHWFYSALCYWENVRATTNSQEKFKFLLEVFKGCEQALALESEHWPALFLRSMVRSMMNSEEVDEMATYLMPTDYTMEEADTDRDRMIDLQKKNSPMPYYLVPYIGQAYSCYQNKDLKASGEWIENGLKETKPAKIGSFSGILSVPFLVLYQEMKKKNSEMITPAFVQRFNDLFPAIKLK